MAEPLEIKHFTEHPDVQACLSKLTREFKDKNKIISDVIDEDGHQFVDLVQKGGGVLGIALVGYTYILEAMDIRFIRLAGTSAGAINTALMTAIGNKTDRKSEKILEAICQLDFFNLVDGHPAARWLIKNFITHKQFDTQAKKVGSIVLGLLAFFFSADIILLGLQQHYACLSLFTKLSFILTGFYLLLLGILIAYISTLLKRLKNSGFGINPGDFFYDWLKDRLKENAVLTVSDLKAKASQKIPGLKLRVDNPEGLNGLEGDVTFITSELVTQNKIEFPKMCNLFRLDKDIDSLQPAGFIRASMSIPVFFESFFIDNIPCDHKQIQDNWWNTFGEKNPPSKARFVDGGILSNFPINIFFNKNVDRPRLPSFGIDLDDSKPANKLADAAAWSLTGYLGRIFNTIRFYYDKDFQIKNRVFRQGVGTIGLAKYNWLNFFLKDDEKIDMFVLGAQAACTFLLNFNWETFKDDREFMQQSLTSK